MHSQFIRIKPDISKKKNGYFKSLIAKNKRSKESIEKKIKKGAIYEALLERSQFTDCVFLIYLKKPITTA